MDKPPAQPILNIVQKEPLVSRDKLSSEERAERKRSEDEESARANEICTKYKKGDIFDFSLEKRGGFFSVILEGVKVGVFGVRDNGPTKQIGVIMLNENLHNKGFGKQLYIKINSYFKQMDGSVLMTDTMKTTDKADGLWSSLERDGLVEEVPDAAPSGHKVYKFKS